MGESELTLLKVEIDHGENEPMMLVVVMAHANCPLLIAQQQNIMMLMYYLVIKLHHAITTDLLPWHCCLGCAPVFYCMPGSLYGLLCTAVAMSWVINNPGHTPCKATKINLAITDMLLPPGTCTAYMI